MWISMALRSPEPAMLSPWASLTATVSSHPIVESLITTSTALQQTAKKIPVVPVSCPRDGAPMLTIRGQMSKFSTMWSTTSATLAHNRRWSMVSMWLTLTRRSTTISSTIRPEQGFMDGITPTTLPFLIT